MSDGKIEIGTLGDADDLARKGSSSGQPSISDLEQLAWILDSSIEIPGLRFRIGVESLLGLIPILGDLLGAAISSYILFLASRMGAARVTLLRMALNVAIESAVGVIPLAGDVFDFGWKANRRNVELLKAHLNDPVKARRSDWFFTTLMILALLAVLALFAWAALATGRAVVRYFRG